MWFAKRRRHTKDAIDHFCAELDIVLEHFKGNHAKCQHGALPPDAQVFACTAQINALARYLGTVKDSASLLLSSVGVTHVQYLESNHAVVACVRRKGVLMSAPASFLDEALEISELVDEHFGIKFSVDESKIKEALRRRLNLKKRRSTAAFKTQVGAHPKLTCAYPQLKRGGLGSITPPVYPPL